MLNKIYLIVLIVFTAIMSVLTFYACSWLSSIDNPRTVVLNYEYYSNLSATFLWISALILLILANVAFWKTRKAWTFWSTFLYFAVFIILHTFWLDRSFFEFKKENILLVGSYSLSPLVGVGVCIAALFIVFFNQFVAAKMRDKMFPPEPTAEAALEDETAGKNKDIE